MAERIWGTWELFECLYQAERVWCVLYWNADGDEDELRCNESLSVFDWGNTFK